MPSPGMRHALMLMRSSIAASHRQRHTNPDCVYHTAQTSLSSGRATSPPSSDMASVREAGVLGRLPALLTRSTETGVPHLWLPSSGVHSGHSLQSTDSTGGREPGLHQLWYGSVSAPWRPSALACVCGATPRTWAVRAEWAPTGVLLVVVADPRLL
eukprot:TRINITY_DN19364_c0_g1_i1.p3 TRINITY_DN19364_c0_g1~~TRINITY_DN19364_c0_g1_i1.p3  ORF type:complete len:156 (-),score=9.01 TRINITY_DN19364_c0_g1_i1:580-1047(-)